MANKHDPLSAKVLRLNNGMMHLSEGLADWVLHAEQRLERMKFAISPECRQMVEDALDDHAAEAALMDILVKGILDELAQMLDGLGITNATRLDGRTIGGKNVSPRLPDSLPDARRGAESRRIGPAPLGRLLNAGQHSPMPDDSQGDNQGQATPDDPLHGPVEREPYELS